MQQTRRSRIRSACLVSVLGMFVAAPGAGYGAAVPRPDEAGSEPAPQSPELARLAIGLPRPSLNFLPFFIASEFTGQAEGLQIGVSTWAAAPGWPWPWPRAR